MGLLGLIVTALYGVVLAFLFGKLLRVGLSPFGYLGAGFFGYWLGVALLGAIGVDPLLVVRLDGAGLALVLGALGVLGMVAIAKFTRAR